MPTELQRQYDAQQEAVINAREGHHLVLAAPGCGKTEVLAERIRRAAMCGVALSDMLCLTFTNRAARSMTDRVCRMLGTDDDEAGQLYVGNIHRYCSRLLFEKGVVPAEASIIDEDDSRSILADIFCVDEEKADTDNRLRQQYSQVVNLSHFMHQYAGDYPRELMVHADALDVQAIRAVCAVLRRPFTRQAIVQIYHDIEELAPLRELTTRDDTRLVVQQMHAATRYTRYKQQHDLLDFEDLLLRVYELPDAYIDRYHWIQVDEIQDLNPLQLAIIDRFTALEHFTVMYLGDNQQAIFSFMGAQTQTLAALVRRCTPQRVHHLGRNYRSPRYLLDVCNEYAAVALGIERALLPQTDNDVAHEPEDLQILMSQNNVDECRDVARLVRELATTHPGQTIAAIVSYNAEADELSAALDALKVPHFKVSGRDLFAEPDVKLLLAHFNVLANSFNFIAWSRLFVGLRLISSHAASREFVRRMLSLSLTPDDFLHDQDMSYLRRFCEVYDRQDIVVFDTETTGLDVFADDIVQIAAVRLRRGQPVGEPLNLFVRSERPIPSMLGNLPNPLLDEYGRQPHLEAAEALARFLEFSRGAVLLAHNADFDYHILFNNLQRHCPAADLVAAHPFYLDSLRLARLLHPRLKSHKLKDLLAEFGLQGENSHRADDDTLATVALVRHCRQQAEPQLDAQASFVATHQALLKKFRAAYADVYHHSMAMLHRPFPDDEPPALVTELAYVYDHFLRNRRIHAVGKLSYLMAALAHDVVRPGERSLHEQLQNHLTDLNTYKESDLCGSQSMTERVFVSTVHKAKGLEFDNVILFDVTDNSYPGYYARQHPERLDEERRRFYVALSRARRRLFLAWSPQKITPWGRVFQSQLSPFTLPIQRFFLMRSF